MGFLLLIIIVALVVLFIIKGIEGTPNHKPVTPPSADVTIIGCQVDCGYFVPKFKESSNGDYDFVKKNGRVVGFCKYQNCDVCQGGPCKFAKDHPDKLSKSVFDDDFL